jgi:FMN-dependent NADH-azoreductase
VSLLRIDASIQGERSASSALADIVFAAFSETRPAEAVVSRHLGAEPLPADAWPAAISAAWTPEDQRSQAQVSAVRLATALASELRDADAAIFALPLYNFGVSQHVKTWIDLVIAGAPNGTRLLDGKPVVLTTSRGGGYGPGTPRAGWDHNTAYLVRIIGEVWGADLTVVERELTLVGVNPALDHLTEIAELERKKAQEAAVEAGQALAAKLA